MTGITITRKKQPPIVAKPSEAMAGKNYGIKYSDEDVIWVSPVIYSLLNDDDTKDLTLQSLRYKVYSRSGMY